MTLFTLLSSTNIDQSASNLVKMYDHKISDEFDYRFNQSRPELFALKFAKIAESDFVYTLASTNIDHMVTVYMTMRSWMSSIIGQI